MKKTFLMLITTFLILFNSNVFSQNMDEIPASQEKSITQEYNESEQVQFNKNTLILANDFIFSLTVSYEQLISMKNSWHAALRGGVGYTAESGDDLSYSLQASILHGKTKHFWESGVAYYQNLTYPDAFIIPLTGYRYMGKKGFIFKVYGDLLLDVIDDSEWGFLNAGFHISVGYRFKI